MTQREDFGPLTGHAIGTILKSAVARAIEHIRARQFTFQASEKEGYEKGAGDFVTDADRGAQRVYEKIFRESFPDFGIVAEEDGLATPCRHPKRDLWLTVDPLDGTKAFIRGQSHGVGTMVSLVCDGKVIAAYVGDVMTGEIYGYRPGSESVWRINRAGRAVRLAVDASRPLAGQYLLFRASPAKHSTLVQAMAGEAERSGRPLFKDIAVDGGSIGVGMARLWKGEVGAMAILPSVETPWDSSPVRGISEKLGFVEVAVREDGTFWEHESRPVLPAVGKRESESLFIHKSRLPELDEWVRRANASRQRTSVGL